MIGTGQIVVCLLLSIYVVTRATGITLEEQENSADFSPMENNLVKLQSDDDCLMVNCGTMTTKSEFIECASLHCRRPVKKWIDTTHYSEGRRSVLDSLERCIRLVCHGKGGLSLKQCAFACSSEKVRRSSASSFGKRWVDPLNYGLGDDKRSLPESGQAAPVTDDEGTASFCQHLCGQSGLDQTRLYICHLRCQVVIEGASSDYPVSQRYASKEAPRFRVSL